ncbi:hypothetical protein FB468_1448 [Leucobacter komagatae]|uniref:DUF4190 domain-containing protein n=1 Tax=Leucobacter komagatae TaxID=55969 RepID=A0A542Y5U3_9MICO|nr:hypothetical protein [Leucobacter komagatae]TQL43427.1 hypothetical protein FB468_1448 [Leucobacter komagatae]
MTDATDDHDTQPRMSKQGVAGHAVATAALAGIGVIAFAVPLASVVCAIAAIIAAFAGRADFRAHPELRGAGLAVFGLTVGVVVVVLQALPWFAGIQPLLALPMTPSG